MLGVNGDEWEEPLKEILGVTERELEIFFALNEYLRDEGPGLTEDGGSLLQGVSIPTLFKGLRRTGSEPMLYRTLEKLEKKGFITRLGKGKYTLNIGAIQEKIKRYKEKELERELIQINKRQKELEALKAEKPIDYLSDAFGGLFIESEKYPEEPISLDRLVNSINRRSTENYCLLIQLHQYIGVALKTAANIDVKEKFRQIKSDKLDVRFIIPLPDSDAKDLFISLEENLKELFPTYYERDNVRLEEAKNIPSELMIFCFVSKPWVELEKEGVKLEDIEHSLVFLAVPGRIEKNVYQGVMNKDSRMVEYFTKSFLRFWETGKKVEEVIGK